MGRGLSVEEKMSKINDEILDYSTPIHFSELGAKLLSHTKNGQTSIFIHNKNDRVRTINPKGMMMVVRVVTMKWSTGSILPTHVPHSDPIL